MSHRRNTPLGIAVGVLLLLALAGCDKPTPGVTVWSGTSSDHREAQCWSSDPSVKVDPARCLDQRGAIGSVDVTPGSTVGISVDPELAANGWYPAIGDKRLTNKPVKETYYRFALSEANLAQPLELRVLALGSAAEDVRGLWLFELARR